MGRNRKGHSPYTKTVVGYVRTHPGCCKMDVALWVRRNPRRNPSRLYHIVNTQLRLGNIVGLALRGNRYSLFVPLDRPAVREKLRLDDDTPDSVLRDAMIDAGYPEYAPELLR